MATDAIVVDPGPDFAKTPAQTVAVLRRLDAVVALGRPVLLAISRKDFIGAVDSPPPRQRDAGTLRRSVTGSTAVRRSCACTTSGRCATTSRCGRRCGHVTSIRR